ncbi:MAG: Coenzyme F420 hydrogenase/dehydrogenase, beta subunit C-terminal domain, partial [Candidatus Bathyarchaeota archaeon]
MENSIQRVLDKGLCIGCGTCYSACPLDAISLVKTEIFTPSIETGRCNHCGLCLSSCPGYHVDYAPQRGRRSKYHDLLGSYRNVYLGHAEDEHIRFMGSSGGAITALLTYALENGIIDGALVVSMNGMNPRVVVARSVAELRQAMGAKYLPVPMNTGLQKILHTDGRFAVAGLPCHLLGLNRIMSIHPALAKKIVLRLGLFCGRGFDYHFVHYFLKKCGISPRSVQELRFRGNGWPGKVYVKHTLGSENRELHLDYSELGGFSGGYLFMPKRCLFCPDHTAELADISSGDAWLPEIKRKDSQGTSLI